MHNGECVKDDHCADYPLTSCDFPGATYCSKCPSDSSKMKLEVCAPTYDSFAPHYDERGVTYWIKTDGTCPVGAICAPANVTWYTKNGNTCVPDEHNNKIIGCKPCYRKENMGPSCVFDVNYCQKSCYPINGAICSNAYGNNNWQNLCLSQTTEDDCKKLGAMTTKDNGTTSFYKVTLPYLYGNAVACCEWAYYGG